MLHLRSRVRLRFVFAEPALWEDFTCRIGSDLCIPHPKRAALVLPLGGGPWSQQNLIPTEMFLCQNPCASTTHQIGVELYFVQGQGIQRQTPLDPPNRGISPLTTPFCHSLCRNSRLEGIGTASLNEALTYSSELARNYTEKIEPIRANLTYIRALLPTAQYRSECLQYTQDQRESTQFAWYQVRYFILRPHLLSVLRCSLNSPRWLRWVGVWVCGWQHSFEGSTELFATSSFCPIFALE